jgi:uncharacterized protein (DUF1499 family)
MPAYVQRKFLRIIFGLVFFNITAGQFSCQRKTMTNLGIHDNAFYPCPEKPNCVSSLAKPSDKTHYISPLSFRQDTVKAMEMLVQVINLMPRSKIITRREDYLHAEFTSLIFRFVDDAEFYFPPGENIIHIRSASRTGHSDLGVNRKRMGKIRNLLEK